MSRSLFVSKAAVAASLAAVAGVASATTLQDLPRGARPGECFSRNSAPAVYRTDHVAVPQPPVESWRDIPAVYENRTRQVLVSPARVDHRDIPAVMGVRVHWIEHTSPDRVVEAPPVYRWVEKQVLISPAHLVWKPGVAAGGYDTGYGAPISVRPTGQVMCRVLVPARWEVRRVRILVAPGRTCVVKGPSSRERVVEHFVVTPAHTIDHPVAAVYRTVTDRVMVRGPRKERITTPQPPRYIDKQVLVTPARTGWSRIACAPPRAVYGVQSYSGPSYAPAPMPHSAPQPQPSYGGPSYAPRSMSHPAPQPQPSYGGQTYRPDYAPERPVQLDGAPAQAYHAPPPN